MAPINNSTGVGAMRPGTNKLLSLKLSQPLCPPLTDVYKTSRRRVDMNQLGRGPRKVLLNFQCFHQVPAIAGEASKPLSKNSLSNSLINTVRVYSNVPEGLNIALKKSKKDVLRHLILPFYLLILLPHLMCSLG